MVSPRRSCSKRHTWALAAIAYTSGFLVSLVSERVVTRVALGPRSPSQGTEYFDVLLGLPPLVDRDTTPIENSIPVDTTLIKNDQSYREFCQNVVRRVTPALDPSKSYDVWIAIHRRSIQGGYPFVSWRADESIMVHEFSESHEFDREYRIPIQADGTQPRLLRFFLLNALIWGSALLGICHLWRHLRSRRIHGRRGFPVLLDSK